MVILVIKDRCCFEPDIEIIRTCHKWGTRLQIVRTKFDVDLRSFVNDRPEKVEELKSRGKFNLKAVAECLREDMAQELTENLIKQGILFFWESCFLLPLPFGILHKNLQIHADCLYRTFTFQKNVSGFINMLFQILNTRSIATRASTNIFDA